MRHETTKIGNYDITVTASDVETSDGFHRSDCTIDGVNPNYRTDTITATAVCGVEVDGTTNRPEAPWELRDEGARLLAALIGGADQQRMKDLLPEECDLIAGLIDEAIRDEVATAV